VVWSGNEPPRHILFGETTFHPAALPLLNSRLRHAFGHVLGMNHAAQNASSYASDSIMHRAWCAGYSTDRLYPTQADADAVRRAYSAPPAVVEHAGSIVTRQLATDRLYARSVDHVDSWHEIAGATREVVAAGPDLYRLTLDGSLERYDGETWMLLDREAEHILPCPVGLCATRSGTGELLELSGRTWRVLGGLARRYAGTTTDLARVLLHGEVQRHGDAAWERIRISPAGRLYVGPAGIHVTTVEAATNDPSMPSEHLETWDREDNTWTELAPPGDYVSSAFGLVWIDRATRTAQLLPMALGSEWQPIGSVGLRIVASGEHLFRIDVEGGVWQYDGTAWVPHGAP
jgi:hypothetical protein